MLSDVDAKRDIEQALKAFLSQPLYEAGMGLLSVLGYRSDLVLRVSGLENFCNTLDQRGRLRKDAAKVTEWTNVEFLCQVTGDDLSLRGQDKIPFQKQFKPTEIQSYVFLAIELKDEPLHKNRPRPDHPSCESRL